MKCAEHCPQAFDDDGRLDDGENSSKGVDKDEDEVFTEDSD